MSAERIQALEPENNFQKGSISWLLRATPSQEYYDPWIEGHGTFEEIVEAMGHEMRRRGFGAEAVNEAVSIFADALGDYIDKSGATKVNVLLGMVPANSAPPMVTGNGNRETFFYSENGKINKLTMQSSLSLVVHAPQGASQQMGSAYPVQKEQGFALQIARAAHSDTNKMEAPPLDEVVDELAQSKWQDISQLPPNSRARMEANSILKAANDKGAMPKAMVKQTLSIDLTVTAKPLVSSVVIQLEKVKNSSGGRSRPGMAKAILAPKESGEKPNVAQSNVHFLNDNKVAGPAKKDVTSKSEIPNVVLGLVLDGAVKRLDAAASKKPEDVTLRQVLMAGKEAMQQGKKIPDATSKITASIEMGTQKGDSTLQKDLAAVEVLRGAIAQMPSSPSLRSELNLVPNQTKITSGAQEHPKNKSIPDVGATSHGTGNASLKSVVAAVQQTIGIRSKPDISPKIPAQGEMSQSGLKASAVANAKLESPAQDMVTKSQAASALNAQRTESASGMPQKDANLISKVEGVGNLPSAAVELLKRYDYINEAMAVLQPSQPTGLIQNNNLQATEQRFETVMPAAIFAPAQTSNPNFASALHINGVPDFLHTAPQVAPAMPGQVIVLPVEQTSANIKNLSTPASDFQIVNSPAIATVLGQSYQEQVTNVRFDNHDRLMPMGPAESSSGSQAIGWDSAKANRQADAMAQTFGTHTGDLSAFKINAIENVPTSGAQSHQEMVPNIDLDNRSVLKPARPCENGGPCGDCKGCPRAIHSLEQSTDIYGGRTGDFGQYKIDAVQPGKPDGSHQEIVLQFDVPNLDRLVPKRPCENGGPCGDCKGCPRAIHSLEQSTDIYGGRTGDFSTFKMGNVEQRPGTSASFGALGLDVAGDAPLGGIVAPPRTMTMVGTAVSASKFTPRPALAA